MIIEFAGRERAHVRAALAEPAERPPPLISRLTVSPFNSPRPQGRGFFLKKLELPRSDGV
jgi:hypothetical protein